MATLRWTKSADKHGIAHDDAVHAILTAEATRDLAREGVEVTRLYIGHPHAQAMGDDYLEVIAAVRPGVMVIFHVMRLSDLYRHLLHKSGG